MNRTLIRGLIALIYSIAIFIIGVNIGNVNSSYKNIDKELAAAEKLFKAQGDNSETIKASLEMIKIDRLNKLA